MNRPVRHTSAPPKRQPRSRPRFCRTRGRKIVPARPSRIILPPGCSTSLEWIRQTRLERRVREASREPTDHQVSARDHDARPQAMTRGA